MKFLLLSIALIFISSNEVLAQIEVPFLVKTLNYSTRKKESGVSVKVFEGSSVVQSFVTDGSGEVKIKLPAGKKYKIEVSKGGKVTRTVSVNLNNVNDELIQGTGSIAGAVEMSLFDELPGIDYSYVTSNVATEFYFDGKSNELQYDQVLAEKMIKKVEKIMKDSEANKGKADAEYNAKIKEADGLYNTKKYAEALASYEQALAIKPTEKYPANRINEIDGILKAEKASAQQNQQAEQEYQNLITAADNLFGQKKYEEAMARYQEALSKKQEQHPKDQIVKCQTEIARLKKEAENSQKYTDAINAGDSFFTQKSFQAAKDKYKEALKWKANDPYATGKLAEIDGKLNAQKAEQEKKKIYEDANTAGDALFAQEKWTEAKVKYQEALAIEPSSAYTLGKIKEVDAKLAAIEKLKAAQAQITKLLAEANTAYTASQWVPSKTKYQEVLKLDATNAIAAARILEIDAKIASEKADVEKIAKIKQLVTEGDALVKQTKLTEAKAKYQEALSLKPDPTVQDKIDAIDTQLLAAGQKAEQKQKYDKAMADGEIAFTAGNFEGAKNKFQEALAIDGTQAVPKKRIVDADKKIAEGIANLEKTEKYNAALAAGNLALSGGQLPEARAKYQEAIALDGTRTEAKDKLAQVDKLIADEVAKNANKAKYDLAVKAGTDLLAANKLSEAKAKFQEAQTLDPSQLLPKQKITEIEGLIANVEKQKQIDGFLKEGDVALGKKDIATARAKYQQVLALDPSNASASSKMLEVAKLENDLAGAAQKEARFKQLKDEATAFMSQSKYAEAKQKLNETKAIKEDTQVDQLIRECDTKMAELTLGNEKEKQYNALIAEAQGLEASKQYDQAIAKYNEAIKVKNEQLPKDRIAAINQLKTTNANQAKIDADYTAAMKRGNDLLAAKSYPEAIAAYNEALALKPNEKEPVLKASEAEKLSNKATDEGENAAYQKILDVGQRSIDEKNYTKAKEMYNRALGFRANDPLPKQKLAEIDALLKAQEDSNKKQIAYQAKVTEAEVAAKAGNIENAITLFEQAKTIKQDETLPDNRIAELRSKLDGSNAATQATEAKYRELMTSGATSEAAVDYTSALARYKEALVVKPKDKVAQDKIAEMQQLLDNISKSDSKRAEIQKLITKADGKFGDERWMDAKAIYESVLALDGTNAYSKERIRLCDEREQKISLDQIEKEYQKILTKANGNFDAKDYNSAKEYYNRALGLRATDPYPKQRLAEIDAILNPKPIVANREPEKLKALGTETDNSIIEGESALAQAERTRKSRKEKRLGRIIERANEKSDSLSTAQQNSTNETNTLLSAIKNENDATDVDSEKYSKGNANALTEIDHQIEQNKKEDGQFENASILDTKGRIDIANKVSEDENNLLDGNATENSELLKITKKDSEDNATDGSREVYQERLDNEKKYMNIQLVLEENAIDDTQDRIDTEHIVRESAKSVIVVTEGNQLRTNETLEAVKKEVDAVAINVSEKQYEETKQSPLNKEKILEIEATQNELNTQDDLEHQENSQTYRGYVEGVDAAVSESVENRDVARKENVEVMESVVVSKEEMDRQSYNALMVRTLGTNGAIRTEVNKQDEFTEEQGVASSENVEKIKQINYEKTEGDRVANSAQDVKHQGSQASLNLTNQLVTENGAVDAEHAKNNEELLKDAKGSVIATESRQSTKQDDKTQSVKQQLSTIEKTEVVYNNQEANDLGKLYPEGVSQEQFEQNDDGGLLTAVVTRRVVVRNGFGQVYTRIQTLSGLSYTKNGEPTTEFVWQRETQDATLTRNY